MQEILREIRQEPWTGIAKVGPVTKYYDAFAPFYKNKIMFRQHYYRINGKWPSSYSDRPVANIWYRKSALERAQDFYPQADQNVFAKKERCTFWIKKYWHDGMTLGFVKCRSLSSPGVKGPLVTMRSSF